MNQRPEILSGESPRALPLYQYQADACAAVSRWFAEQTGNCLVVVPTGGGKSLIMAALAREAIRQSKRVLIITHRRELIEQNVLALRRRMQPSSIGIASAVFGKKDGSRPVTVATIQSLARHPGDYGPYDLILCDECHLIPRAKNTQYQQLLRTQLVKNPHARLVGLSATPYRLDSGRMDEGADRLFDGVAYECSLLALIKSGYLTRLVSKATVADYDVSGVPLAHGDYQRDFLEHRVNTPEATAGVVSELQRYASNRQRILLFAAGIQHALDLAHGLNAAGIATGAIHGGLTSIERATLLAQFRSGKLRALTNCEILTTGYDEPSIDCIALCRPTRSPVLHVQMIGRGLRTHGQKENTLVLDFAGNTMRLGPIDEVEEHTRLRRGGSVQAPAKTCPQCSEIVASGCKVCPDCEFAFPERSAALIHATATDGAALTYERVPARRFVVEDTAYVYHRNAKDAGAPPSLRVDYFNGGQCVGSQFHRFEHQGEGRKRAHEWWGRVSPDTQPPDNVGEALRRSSEARKPWAVLVRAESGTPVIVYSFWRDHAA